MNSDPASASPNVNHAIIIYDAAGRKSTVENPTCSSGDPTYGNTTNVDDALGRFCVVVPPGGTAASSCPTTAPSSDVFTSHADN